MTEGPKPTHSIQAKEPEKKHPVQKLMDNTWLLLAIGILIPSLSYTAWGWIELLFVKTAPLP